MVGFFVVVALADGARRVRLDIRPLPSFSVVDAAVAVLERPQRPVGCNQTREV